MAPRTAAAAVCGGGGGGLATGTGRGQGRGARGRRPPPPARARAVRREGRVSREGEWVGPASRGGHPLYWRVEDAGWSKPPLLVLHGGPGVPHDYLLPLGALARAGRSVVFYDQLGCGGSAVEEGALDPALFGIPQAVAELEHVLGLVQELVAEGGGQRGGRLHLLGQSWGGILGFEAVHAGLGDRLQSLTLSNAPASVALVEAEARRLIDAAGSAEAFMARHNCRADPVPDNVAEAYSKGAVEFRGSGAIAGWTAARCAADSTAAWPEHLPALLVSGEEDFVTPECMEPWLELLPAGSEWQLVPGSHMPFNELDNVDAFLAVVDAFLAAND